uniref:Capsid protein n=1 Tax=Parvoviridae sp. TaxID=1940570 RepID=A0A7D3UKB0_9VIRU|nr:MAG: capsid protein [Parvoviridae sp.]
MYERIEDATAVTGWIGWKTPWRVLDWNMYAAHFSPQDFQYLINNFSEWKPESMSLQTFNIQGKTVSASGTEEIINNNLTATLMIQHDGSHNFPHTLIPTQAGKWPVFPNDPYRPPQYAYLTGIDINDITKLNSNSPFYILETGDIQQFGTGDSFGTGQYMFDCAHVHNQRAVTRFWDTINPLQDIDWGLTGYVPTKPADRTQYPWEVQTRTWQGSATTAGNQFAMGVNNNVTPLKSTNMNPMVYLGNSKHKFEVTIPLSDQVETATMAPSKEWGKFTLAQGTKQFLDNAGSTGTVVTTADGACNYGDIKEHGAAHYYGPIWAKKPNADIHHPIRSDGAVYMSNPPGQIFARPSPVPTYSAKTFENVYFVCDMTVEMKWSLKRFHTKQWNPLNLYSGTAADQNNGWFLVDEQGEYRPGTSIMSKQLPKLW